MVFSYCQPEVVMNWISKATAACSVLILGGTFFLQEAKAGTENRVESEIENLESYKARSSRGVVAADELYASQAAASILEQGGTAADAGVTALLMLGITNPFASGLGGGGFCLYREAEKGATTVLDFREVAPLDAHRDLYLVEGEHRPELARHGGLAVGIPGEAAGIWALHGRFGRLEWADVVEPARRFADQGFPVGATLAGHLENLQEMLLGWPELARVFQNEEGEFLKEGDFMARDDLVRSLTLLRDEGVRPFYVGPVADAMVEAANQAGGILRAEDFSSYAVIPRDAVRAEIGGHEILSMPPPSSGGIALIQALQILETFAEEDLEESERLHVQIEALKHAFADRARWLGDADFVDVPVEKLTSLSYAQELARRIDLERVLSMEEYGTTAPDEEGAGTSHLSIIDAEGNMLACTTTINTRFGSLVYVPEYGIILNNEMADFNTRPGEANLYGLIGNEQNAVAPQKRPLSSMSPTLVLRQGEPLLSIGASGGPTIITGVYFALIRLLLEGQSPLETIAGPRLHHQWVPETLFVDNEGHDILEGLRERGHQIRQRPSFTAVQFVIRDGEEWVGVSDPRKGGIPAVPGVTRPGFDGEE